MDLLQRLFGRVVFAGEGAGSGAPAEKPAAPAAEPAAPASPEPAPAAPAAPEPKVPDAPAKEPAESKAEPKAAEKATREFPPTLLHEAIKSEDEKKPDADKDAKAAEKPGDAKADAKADEKKPEEKKAEGEAKQDDKDSKTKDAPGEMPPAPVYEFKLPEGFKPEDLDNESLTAFKSVLGEDRVAPERAQKLLDMHIGEIKKVADVIEQRQWDAFQNVTKTWRDETMADPVIGGSRHATAMNTVMNFINEYGGDAAERAELLAVFKATGITNNKRFLSVLYRAGEAMSREARPHPVPPQRVPAKSMQDKRLGRYANTTPIQNGAGP